MNTHKCALHNITLNPLLGFAFHFHMPSDYSHHLHVPSLITLVMKPNSTETLCQSHLLLSAYKWPHSGSDSTQDMCTASSSGHKSSTWLQSSVYSLPLTLLWCAKASLQYFAVSVQIKSGGVFFFLSHWDSGIFASLLPIALQPNLGMGEL